MVLHSFKIPKTKILINIVYYSKDMKNRALRAGIVGGLVPLVVGCSAALDGMAIKARSVNEYNLLRTGAAAARVYEADERARNTTSRGLNDIANSLGQNLSVNDGQGEYVQQNGLQVNPLFWSADEVDSNGEYIAFIKEIGMKKKIGENYSQFPEVFIMRNDGTNLKRLTFNRFKL